MAQVAITTKFFPEEIERLKRAGHDVCVHEGNPLGKEALIAFARDAEALIVALSDRIDEGCCRAFPGCASWPI